MAQQDLGMPEDIAAELRAIGARIETERTAELYAPLQPKEPYSWLDVARDRKYGPHERNVLDVFTAPDPGAGNPVVVFVHAADSRAATSAPKACRSTTTSISGPSAKTSSASRSTIGSHRRARGRRESRT